MITEKKNQHYIPKFYLRNFSFEHNKKQIGVFNIFNECYIQKAKLKTQGSKNFFYGYDGKIEDRLAEIEGTLSQSIREIISTYILPNKNTNKHFDLLEFVSLTDSRNPVQIEKMKQGFVEMEKRILELDSTADVKKLVPQVSHDEHIKLSLSLTLEMVNVTRDLDYKLLVNDTEYPFITSDFPVVKYNLFLEQKRWEYSKTGYGLIGLKIFIPITPKLVIVFFDSGIYKFGNKKDKTIMVNKKEDIKQLNILQFVNCFGTIFFNENITETYIRSIFSESKKYQRANITKSELGYIVSENDDASKKPQEKQNLLILNASDCEIGLNLSFLKIHTKGKCYQLNSTMSQLRKHPALLKKMGEI